MPGCDLQCRCPDLQGAQFQWTVVLMQWLACPDFAATAAACQPHLHATCSVMLTDWNCCGFVDRFTHVGRLRYSANTHDRWVSSQIQWFHAAHVMLGSQRTEAGFVLCCAVLCCAVLCCAELCCAVLCCAVLRCAVLCFWIFKIVQRHHLQ